MDRFKVIFEDKDLLAVDKPAGLTVHEGSGHTGVTLVDQLAEYLPNSPLKEERYGLVHRLDKDTSGVLLVAKTPEYFAILKQLFKQRKIEKEYLALVHGRLTPNKGIIKIPLRRDMAQRTRFTPSRSGRLAETHYEVVWQNQRLTELRVWPKTGRTHQIRVHLASLGHPIVGDKVYGKSDSGPARQFLHAHTITFTDPNGRSRSFTAPLATDLKNYLHDIKK